MEIARIHRIACPLVTTDGLRSPADRGQRVDAGRYRLRAQPGRIFAVYAEIGFDRRIDLYIDLAFRPGSQAATSHERRCAQAVLMCHNLDRPDREHRKPDADGIHSSRFDHASATATRQSGYPRADAQRAVESHAGRRRTVPARRDMEPSRPCIRRAIRGPPGCIRSAAARWSRARRRCGTRSSVRLEAALRDLLLCRYLPRHQER